MASESNTQSAAQVFVAAPGWLRWIFKIFGLAFFAIAVLVLVDVLIPDIIAQWPIRYPLIDLGLYQSGGFFIISIILGLGWFRMRRWLVPVLAASLFSAGYLAARGYGDDYVQSALASLVLLIIAGLCHRYLKGGYWSRKIFLIYFIFLLAIILILYSARLPVYGLLN